MTTAEPEHDLLSITAGNPSAMTGPGTTSHVLRRDGVAMVLDPGPALPAHEAALCAAVAGHRVAAILVTHAHLDHSALALPLGRRLGAPVLAYGTAREGRSAMMEALARDGLAGSSEGLDLGFVPDVRLSDGDRVALADLSIEVLHLPGHLPGHLGFALGEVLFPGDTVMGWSSSVVAPPDGDMAAYRASLARLALRPWRRALPTHGQPIEEPAARIAALIAHRDGREAQILEELRQGPATAAGLARRIYPPLDPALALAAEGNVLAHLIELTGQDRVKPLTPLARGAEFALC